MASPSQPTSTQKTSILDNALVQQALEKYGPQIVSALVALFVGLFHKKPKDVPVVAPPATPVLNTPVPISVPSVSVPAVGIPTRTVARVRLIVQKAEKPDMSTPERRQDPGNLYPDPQGMVDSGSAFNFGATLWLDQTAFDQDGDEWQGNSIVAAGKEYKTRHEIHKDGTLVAFIQGEGGSDEHTPFNWNQQESDSVNVIRSRPWIDSVGMNVAFRFAAEGTYTAKSWFDGVKANEIVIRIS